MYAGTLRLYYPQAQEFAAVDALLETMARGEFGDDVELVYRPLFDVDVDRDAALARYADRPQLRLQLPQPTCYYLNGLPQRPMRDELTEYLDQLREPDVVVTSMTSSLGLDAAYLGRPVVANFADTSGVLARRGVPQLLEADLCALARAGMPLARTIPELLAAVRRLLDDRPAAAAIARALVREWDYPATDFGRTLASLVGEVPKRAPLELEEPVLTSATAR